MTFYISRRGFIKYFENEDKNLKDFENQNRRERDILDKVVHASIGHHLILNDWIVCRLLHKAMVVI
jgi:hypothetical protein